MKRRFQRGFVTGVTAFVADPPPAKSSLAWVRASLAYFRAAPRIFLASEALRRRTSGSQHSG
jgi:hypothetical protein